VVFDGIFLSELNTWLVGELLRKLMVLYGLKQQILKDFFWILEFIFYSG
jgi:hypothetical protein